MPETTPGRGSDSAGPDPWALVMRAIEAVGTDVRTVQSTMVTRDVWEEGQRGAARRFETLEKRQAEWEAKSESAHVVLDKEVDAARADAVTRIEALRTALDVRFETLAAANAQREKETKAARSQVWLAILAAFLAIVAPRLWVLLSIPPPGGG